ncbi:MAG: hypothetical protein Q9170_000813 [Blastenia crenularia]
MAPEPCVNTPSPIPSSPKLNNKRNPTGIFLFHPKIPNHPSARFPGVVVFSEIYQVTGPVARFARQIAGHGYIVAAPSSYHEFTGPEPLAYDAGGTDEGNAYKIRKVRDGKHTIYYF